MPTAHAVQPRTLVDKIWDSHVVHEEAGAPSVLAIDLHLVHEVTSPQAFTGLRQRGLKVQARSKQPLDDNVVQRPSGIMAVNFG